jgi:hypothetical protein
MGTLISWFDVYVISLTYIGASLLSTHGARGIDAQIGWLIIALAKVHFDVRASPMVQPSHRYFVGPIKTTSF